MPVCLGGLILQYIDMSACIYVCIPSFFALCVVCILYVCMVCVCVLSMLLVWGCWWYARWPVALLQLLLKERYKFPT